MNSWISNSLSQSIRGAMANEPEIGGRGPIVADVVASGSDWRCRCGRSKTQPFWRDSHEEF